MGLFDFLKRKPKKTNVRPALTQSGFTPLFTDFGDSIYASDIIVQAIRCKANEFRKLKPRHIRIGRNGNKENVLTSSIAKKLYIPNEYMTQSDFLEKITILLELNKNAFVYPTYFYEGNRKIITGLYPLKPTNAEYLSDQYGELFIRFTFGNGYRVELPIKDVIHIRKDYGVDDYFGGNISGLNDERGLLNLLKEYDKITQSIAIALNCSLKINGLVKTNSYLEDNVIAKRQQEFNEKIANNESGILFTDLKTEYTNIPHDIKLVDKDTIQYFYEAILRNTGVSLAILNGDYTKAQKEAFYESALEADIKNLGEAFTKVIFNEDEINHGNSIVFYPNSIVFMSMENKIAALQAALPAGLFTKDEGREILGYPPLPNGQGQVIAQGYNSLLDENNNNKLSNDNKIDKIDNEEQEGGASEDGTNEESTSEE